MECRRCASCDQAFRPRAQVPQQRYCGKAACQRERRRRWQQSRLQGDGDYRANQAQAQQAWAGGHGDYWREYRANHPEYTDRNRLEQRRRDRRQACDASCKDGRVNADSSGSFRDLPSGGRAGGDLAKMDAWTVKITLISRDYTASGEAGAILQREDVIGAAGPPC